MNSKKLLILCVVAIVAIAGGVWLAGERASNGGETTAKLYPDLDKKLNDATVIAIFTAGDKKSVELARKDSAWRVTERDSYAADETKLRKLLVSIADAELSEEKTSNPENYASLGVEDLNNAAATGVRIEVSGVEPPVNLIVGKQGPGVQSRYVRRAGEEKSWLVDTQIDNSSTPKDWLRKSILDVSADRIQSATITTPNAKPYSAAKAARSDANFAVEGLPKGRELSSPTAANGLATALAGLTLSDVEPASAFTVKPEAQATFRTFDGLAIELDGWSRDDKRFIAVRAHHDAALADRFKLPAAESKDEAAKKESSNEASEASKDPQQKAEEPAKDAAKPNVAEEAKTTGDKLTGWVFEIPDYKYDSIFKPLQEMLKDGSG
jgi:hypothetical protein